MYEVKVRAIHDTKGLFSQGDMTDRPASTVTQSGVGQHLIEYYLTESPPPMEAIMIQDKPEYRVLSMLEIQQIPWNGYNVISTFSGCGGSCLGYEMAGFKVLWANEFIPIAAETYRLNHPGIVDERDIREIQPEDILKAIDMEKGELDLMDGSPPCDSFSTAGKRDKNWGKEKAYLGKRQRTDDLFFEYARLLEGLQPKVFVAENVSGLVKGKAKGYFKLIMQRLQECGYNVKAKCLDAQWLGVPQMRQRVIFIGVRNDLKLEPVYPKPLHYRYTVRDVLPWIVRQGDNGGYGKGNMRAAEMPSPTIGTGTQAGNGQFPPSLVEAETDISRYAIGREWEKMKQGEGSDKYLNLYRNSTEKPSGTVTQARGSTSAAAVTHPTEKRKFSIAELKRICAFPDDFQLIGKFAQQWARMGLSVPPVMMYHIANNIETSILDKVQDRSKVHVC